MRLWVLKSPVAAGWGFGRSGTKVSLSQQTKGSVTLLRDWRWTIALLECSLFYGG